MPTLTALLGLLRSALADRQRLLLENAALRHQVAVLKRSVSRPRLDDSDRLFWIALRRLHREWKDWLLFVRPETFALVSEPVLGGLHNRYRRAG